MELKVALSMASMDSLIDFIRTDAPTMHAHFNDLFNALLSQPDDIVPREQLATFKQFIDMLGEVAAKAPAASR